MTDIVERLRDPRVYYVTGICAEAADTIERLRAAARVTLSSLEHLGMDAFADAPYLIRSLHSALDGQ